MTHENIVNYIFNLDVKNVEEVRKLVIAEFKTQITHNQIKEILHRKKYKDVIYNRDLLTYTHIFIKCYAKNKAYQADFKYRVGKGPNFFNIEVQGQSVAEVQKKIEDFFELTLEKSEYSIL